MRNSASLIYTLSSHFSAGDRRLTPEENKSQNDVYNNLESGREVRSPDGPKTNNAMEQWQIALGDDRWCIYGLSLFYHPFVFHSPNDKIIHVAV